MTHQLSLGLSGPSDAPAAETVPDPAPAGKRPPRGDSGAARGDSGATPETAACRCVLRGIGRYDAGWWHDRGCPAYERPPAELLERDAGRAEGRPLSEGRRYQWLGPWHGLQRPGEADRRRG
jgi:hypothetical protein